ncbi:hypothetical protein PO124_10040 [Bacillus licheniformis]|nr:hypothetical protein [Bacillus licheniformis]
MSVKPHYFIGIPIPAELSDPLYQTVSSRPEFSFIDGCILWTTTSPSCSSALLKGAAGDACWQPQADLR